MAARDQTVTPWGVSFQYTVDSEQMTLQTLQDATCERALPHRGACIGLALAPRRPVFPNAGTLFTSLGPAMQSGKSHLLSQPNVPIYTRHTLCTQSTHISSIYRQRHIWLYLHLLLGTLHTSIEESNAEM